MINKECFTTEWIYPKSIELKYNDKNLIEKVIRAFSLLEMLAASGCLFYYKALCVAIHKPFCCKINHILLLGQNNTLFVHSPYRTCLSTRYQTAPSLLQPFRGHLS